MEKKTKLLVNLGASSGGGGGSSGGTKLYQHSIFTKVYTLYEHTKVEGDLYLHISFINEASSAYTTLKSIIEALYNIYGSQYVPIDFYGTYKYQKTSDDSPALIKSVFVQTSSTSAGRKLWCSVQNLTTYNMLNYNGNNIVLDTINDVVTEL